MRKFKIGRLILFCFVFLAITCSASAGSLIPAKQLLITRLKSTDVGYDDSFRKSSGTVSCEIQSLGGSMAAPEDEVIKALAGAKLALDYKLNAPEKKLEMHYQLNAPKDSYRGGVFINNDKIILTKEVLLLGGMVNPEALDTAEYSALPPYGYFSDRNMAEVWNVLLNNDAKNTLPAYRDLLVFIVEAVPERFFTTSLADQKIILHIDQEGLADVVFSVAQKIRSERERFAELFARLLALSNPAEDFEAVKAEVMNGIEEAVKRGDFPGSAGEIQEAFADELKLEITFEIPLLPAGKSRLILAADITDNYGFTGKIAVDASFAGSKDNYQGSYDIVLSIREKRDSLSGRIFSEFERTGPDLKNNGQIRFKMAGRDGADTMLDLSVLFNINTRYGENVPVNIPPLTESNSVNITTYREKIS
ncbi:MAG: hypothetical protein K6T65_04525 [Peptococcaceae bacterium]|nr:hypothetical protein [Peptococcaceae bacterium]